MPRKRYSHQKKQEQISRKQFEAFLEPYDWVTGDIEPDFGEDILVRIYRDGVSTGLSLYIQLKSVKSIAARQLKSGEISYKFDVDDLCHWEVQTPMVFIVIWDVTQQMGWWISVTEAIQYLEKHNPGWRKNSSIAVRIPFENRMDEAGLNKIRSTLADLYGPVIGKGKQITINTKFLFPKTPEGQAKFDALQRTMAAGDAIELDGQYIQEFSLPDWWTRIHGEPDPKEMVLWIGSIPSNDIIPMQIEFQSHGFQPESLPYIEFKRVKEGFEETTLSNAHQDIPMQFNIVIKPGAAAFTINVNSNYVGKDGQTGLQLINIEKMFAQGGKVQIMSLKTGKASEYLIPPNSRPVPEPRFALFVENLAAIQQKTGRALRIPEFAALKISQMKEAQELASIVTTGEYIHTTNQVEIDVLKFGVEQLIRLPQSGDLFLRVEYANVVYELLGEEFELGPCVRTIHGKLSNPYDEISAWYEQAGDNDSYKIKLAMPEITDEYPNWKPLKTR